METNLRSFNEDLEIKKQRLKHILLMNDMRVQQLDQVDIPMEQPPVLSFIFLSVIYMSIIYSCQKKKKVASQRLPPVPLPRTFVGTIDDAGDGQGDFLRISSPRSMVCSDTDSISPPDIFPPLTYTILEPISIEVFLSHIFVVSHLIPRLNKFPNLACHSNAHGKLTSDVYISQIITGKKWRWPNHDTSRM